MNLVSRFRYVWMQHGLVAALMKALAHAARKRVLVEGLDEDFPPPAPVPDLAMPTMEDARLWHTGYGGRWKHVLPLPNARMMLHVGAATVDNFYFVGDAWAQLLARHVLPGSHVMDIGCGCGRTARFLVTNPFVTKYTDFDVIAPYVDWCNRFFGEIHGDRFTFFHVDVRTARYNPEGTLEPASVRFPADDGDVDMIFAASVFTHMYPAHIRAYAREMRRVLGPRGKAMVSIHDKPGGGEEFSGTEHRADYDVASFLRMMDGEGFDLAEDIGDVCGQRAMVLQKQ